jgi:UDP-3-O-[3-hydroxymyristoyl] N-acetylglucosamine deacetylase
VLGSGINSVGTIEHLMASFYALGIDNASIKLNGPEVPIMDGSSAIFVKTLLDAGIKTLDASKKLYIVKSAFEYKSGDKFVRVEPSNKLIFDCTIDFENSFIGRQSLSLTLNPKEFAKIMSARTFCHQREIDVMRNAGYALGGSLENAVVVAENGVLNQGGLRYKDEFVRHKMLDCIGDLALIGGFLLAKVTTYKSGHSLHSNFLTEILKNKSKHFSIVEPIGLTDEQSVPVFAEQSLMSLHTI